MPVKHMNKSHPSSKDNKFVVAGNVGTLIFYDAKENTEVQNTHLENAPVEDAQWNPGENYLLVCYKDSSMKLFESDKEIESFEFDPQGFG